jgi:hypothetical protein
MVCQCQPQIVLLNISHFFDIQLPVTRERMEKLRDITLRNRNTASNVLKI